MKSLRNLKRLAFALISTLLLCCNLTKAAAVFDPLKDHKPRPMTVPLGSFPCEWPDPPINPGPDPGPGAPDCVSCAACVVD